MNLLVVALILSCISFVQQQQQQSMAQFSPLAPLMRMLSSLVQPNPLIYNANNMRQTTTTTTAKPAAQQQPLSVFNWFMSPLRLAVLMKKYEFQPMNLPKEDDTFFFDTKRDWGIPLGITCACLAPLMIALNIWTYMELRPFRLPRHPTDQSTFLSRMLAGEERKPLQC